jgi:hypothetical protein
MILSRRSLFAGGAVLLAAPAIVRVASLMPISVQKPQLLTYRIVTFAVSEGEVEFYSGTTWAPSVVPLRVGDTFTINRLPTFPLTS